MRSRVGLSYSCANHEEPWRYMASSTHMLFSFPASSLGSVTSHNLIKFYSHKLAGYVAYLNFNDIVLFLVILLKSNPTWQIGSKQSSWNRVRVHSSLNLLDYFAYLICLFCMSLYLKVSLLGKVVSIIKQGNLLLSFINYLI